MKRNKLAWLCALLVLVVLSTSIFMVSCKDPEPEKSDAYIIAQTEQTYIYDGQVHNVVASLNHDETQLKYDPAQGYADKGEYEITVSADETENYKATSKKITLKIVDAPAKSTFELWEDFTDGMSKAFALEGKEKFKVNIQAAASVKNSGKTTSYAIDVMGNIDLSQTQNNSTLFHAIVSADGNNIGLYYQDNTMYLEVGNQIFKIKNSDLTSILTSVNAPQATSGADLSGLIDLLPVILFRDADDIVCNDGVYEITIDISHIWEIVNSDMVKNFLTMISDENLEILGEFFEQNEMQFKFAVDLSDSDNAFANITVNDGNASLGAFEIAGGSYDYVSGKLDDDKIQSASEINLANIFVTGNIDLLDRTGKDYEHLTYKLVADIDPFALVNAIKSNPNNWMNDEAVKKMKLYFSIYHEHTPGEQGVICTDAMCPTRKGGQTDTSILDIAFDPANFGNGRLYVALNLSRIVSETSLKKTVAEAASVSEMIAGIALNLLGGPANIASQNFMTSIDLGLLIDGFAGDGSDEPSAPEDPFEFDINTMLDPILSIITKCLSVGDSGITLNLNETYALLNSAFDLDQYLNINLAELTGMSALSSFKNITTSTVAKGIFDGLLSPDKVSDEKNLFGSMRIGVNSVELGTASDFNCAEAIMNLPTDSNVARDFGGHKPLSIEDANKQVVGDITNLKGDEIIYSGSSELRLTEGELNKLIGKRIHYSYTAFDNNVYTAHTQIVDIIDYDPTKIGEMQTIKVAVLPLDGQGGLFSGFLFDKVFTGTVGGALANTVIPLAADVLELDVKLMKVVSIEELIVDNECPETFELAPIELNSDAKIDMSQYMSGKIKVTYQDGSKGEISIVATSDNLIDGVYLVNDGNEYSFVFKYLDFEVMKTVNVKTVSPSKPALVDGGDGAIKVEIYGAEQKAKLKLLLQNSSGSTTYIQENQYRATVNGQLISDIDLSSDGAKSFEISKSFEDYKIEFDRTTFTKDSSASYLWLYLYGENDEVLSKVKLSNSTKDTVKFLMEHGEFGDLGKTSNVCANLDGKLTYYYWNADDDKYADARTLVLTFIDGKYYMVDSVENPTVKIQATVTASKKGDSTKTNILSDDYTIAWDVLKAMSYDAAKKGTQVPSIDVTVKFTLNEEEKSISKTNVSLSAAKPYELGSVSADVIVGKTFDGMAKYTITTQSGEKHVMELAYKGGKYVLTDTFAGEKFEDIEVSVVAKSTASGNPEIALTDGAFTSEQVGEKVNLILNFIYDGFEYSYKFGSSKTVKAAN